MSRRTRVALLISSLSFPLLSVAAFAGPGTITVPGEQPTIQAAIDHAVNGDVIRVAAGTYLENIDFKGKAISLVAAGGKHPVIIDGQRKGPVVMFRSQEGPGSVLNGFVIQNGDSEPGPPGYGVGAGIYMGDDASPTITNNTIQYNYGCEGVGIGIQFGSPLVSGNRIAHNQQFGCSGGTGGGGIGISGAGHAVITNNIIEYNAVYSADGGGISLFAAGYPTITGNIIRKNYADGLSPCASGGGIAIVNFANTTIAQNQITGNYAGCGGGVYWAVPSQFGSHGPDLTNNTIADNFGQAIYAAGFDAAVRLTNNVIMGGITQDALYCASGSDGKSPVISFNDIYAGSGHAYSGICHSRTGSKGNVSADPLFVNANGGNYHLQNGSPVIDKGSNTAVHIATVDFDATPRIQDGDANGTAIVDMGFDEFGFDLAAARNPAAADARGAPAPRGAPVRGLPEAMHVLETRDGRRTVYTYDAAGRLVTETGPDGRVRRWK